ncbi:sensor domain-containing protein [Actinomycetes bacterium M1A6_2h]
MGRRTGAAALAAGAALLLGGCGGSTVTGSPEPSSAAPLSSAPIQGTLDTMLINPSVFPSPYQAVVLPQQAAAAAAQDLDGIGADASVDPVGCKPSARGTTADSTALVVGTDNDTRATISVELTRVRDSLADQRSQWEQCPSVKATSDDVVSTVTTDLVPAPPIDADDTAAYRRTVTSGSGEVTQSMLSLVAQKSDVRITATFMSFSGDTPDSATLDELFTRAVQKVG